MIIFNKPPSDKIRPETDLFTDKHRSNPGSLEASSHGKSCREMRIERLKSSTAPYSQEDVDLLNKHYGG